MNHSLVATGIEYGVRLLGPDGRVISHELVHNLTPLEGLQHYANVLYKGAAQVSNWYLALFEGNYVPQASDTAATFAALATECTAYSEGTRELFVPGAAAGGALDNHETVAEFTFTEAKTIYGAAMLSSPTKGGTGGVLSSIARFTSPKQPDIGSVLQLTAGVAFASA